MKTNTSILDVSRRGFLKGAGALSLLAAFRGHEVLAQTPPAPVLWVQFHVTGGWDQLLFCDPKFGTRVDSSGGFFNLSQLKRVGSIPYVDAYDAANPLIRPIDPFFQEFGADRLTVINGIDAGTNNHDVGTRCCMTGDRQEGYPIFAAQVAGISGHGMVAPMMDFSGYDESGGLTVPARLDYIGAPTVASLRDPNVPSTGGYSPKNGGTVDTEELLASGPRKRVLAAQAARLQRLKTRLGLPSHARALAALESARASVPGLANIEIPSLTSDLVENMKALSTMGIHAFAAGLAASMNIAIGGGSAIDAHGTADYLHLTDLGYALDVARHIVNTADAQPKPVPTILVMTSDFGRTPVREPPGSGHWPISSMMILQNNAAKALKLIAPGVIGGTTGLAEGPSNLGTVLRARKINPKTHAFDDSGVVLSCAHVHRALRRVAGIADNSALRAFPLPIDGNELELG